MKFDALPLGHWAIGPLPLIHWSAIGQPVTGAAHRFGAGEGQQHVRCVVRCVVRCAVAPGRPHGDSYGTHTKHKTKARVRNMSC